MTNAAALILNLGSLALLLTIQSGTADAATPYRVIRLPLPQGAVGITAAAIGNDGKVVGTVYPSGASMGFSYQEGTMALLATPAGHTSTWASAVNDAGEIVGGTTDAGIPKAVIWSSAFDQSPEVLESSGGNDANVYATGINNQGVVSGFYTGSGSGNVSSWRAVKWVADDQGRLRQEVLTTSVSPLPPGVFHAAYGINNAGQVVGTGAWLDPDLLIPQAAIRWAPDGQPVELAVPVNFDFAPRLEAQAINDSGIAVGKLTTNSGVPRALLWTADAVVTDLSVLPGFLGSDALDINSAGVVVGTHSAGAVSVAALYRDGEWTDLNTQVFNMTGWTLQSAVSINDADWIVGNGTFNGAAQAFMLVPLYDVAGLSACLWGPGVTPTPSAPQTTGTCLQTYDLDEDADVDLVDFAILQTAG